MSSYRHLIPCAAFFGELAIRDSSGRTDPVCGFFLVTSGLRFSSKIEGFSLSQFGARSFGSQEHP